MNALELLFFVVALTVGILGAATISRLIGWIGYPLGFVLGFLVVPFLLYLAGYAEQLLYRGRPFLPACRKGKCREADYTLEISSGRPIYVCRCGDCYLKKGRHVHEVRADGSLGRYMVWRAFRGWVQDD